MAKLIYAALTSLDGYVSDEAGNFYWAVPDGQVHSFINELERPIGTYLRAQDVRDHGRLGDTGYDSGSDTSHARVRADLAGGGQDRVLEDSADGVHRQDPVERKFDAEVMRGLKADATRDVAVGGPVLPAHAIRAGLVDGYHVFVALIIVGSGNPYLPDNLRLGVDLDLIDARRFADGVA